MVDAMVEDHEIKRPMTKRLSRWVYRLLVFVAAWFALAVWSFAGPAVTDYLP
jgi:low affinity Fe/Cu permease